MVVAVVAVAAQAPLKQNVAGRFGVGVPCSFGCEGLLGIGPVRS